MKKIILPLFTLVFLTLAACASLSEKSVAVASRVDALKIETSGSASSGTISPNLMVGGGANCLSTSRAFLDSERAVPTFSYSSSGSFFGSLFGLDVSSTTMTYTGSVDESAAETVARLTALEKLVKKEKPVRDSAPILTPPIAPLTDSAPRVK